MTTCKTLIDAALARRTANEKGVLATDAELIGVIDRVVKGLYALIGRAKPSYFGTIASVTPADGAWAKPSDAVVIERVESNGAAGTGAARKITAVGKEVHRTPFTEREAEHAPAIYEYGGKFYSVGRTDAANPDPSSDANGDTLKIFYSKRHPSLDATLAADHATNTLDSTWPEHYNDLLVIPVARYLAIKDGREVAEIAALQDEHNLLKEQLLEEVGMVEFGVRRRFGHDPRVAGVRARTQ